MRLILLSDEFYNRYGNCEEILQKASRPYVCLEMLIEGLTFAIPLRHHIAHKHSFITYEDRGLDYTKSVVVSCEKYIAIGAARQIDQKEFNALKGKEQIIYNGLKSYIKLYEKAVKFSDSPHYANIIRFSSLQYFDEQLVVFRKHR